MRATYFLQCCPTCGRQLQVRVEYLGKSLFCQHCHGEFVATDNESLNPTFHDPVMELAEKLLATEPSRRPR